MRDFRSPIVSMHFRKKGKKEEKINENTLFIKLNGGSGAHFSFEFRNHTKQEMNKIQCDSGGSIDKLI